MFTAFIVLLLSPAICAFAAELINRNISWSFEGKNDPIVQITNESEVTVAVGMRLLFGDNSYRYPSDLEIPSGENRFLRIRDIVNEISTRYSEVRNQTTGVLQMEFEGTDQTLRTQLVNLNPRSGITSERQSERAPLVNSIEPKSGDPAGGTIVTITGQNFGEGASVKFGGLPALRSRESDSVLIAVAPAHATGLVDVEIRNGRRAALLRRAFRYESAGPVITQVEPDSGSSKGGFRVNIQGKNFVPGSVVQWNGTPVAARFASPEAISVLAPSGAAGSVSVQVVNPDHKTFVLPDAFTYKGLPRVTSLTPDMGNSAGGYTITVYGNNFDEGCSVLFGAQYGQTTFINSSALAAIVPGGKSGYVNVSVSNKDGDKDTAPSGFLYNDPPRILNIEAEPSSIVRNTTSTITVQAADPEAGPLTYEYRVALGPAGGIVTGQGDHATYQSPNTTGTATIQITVYDEHRATAQGNLQIVVE